MGVAVEMQHAMAAVASRCATVYEPMMWERQCRAAIWGSLLSKIRVIRINPPGPAVAPLQCGSLMRWRVGGMASGMQVGRVSCWPIMEWCSGRAVRARE